MGEHAEGKRPRGRPRDPAIEEAILQAALHRLVSEGYSRMSVADVAKDAGVTKPTLYLRWPSKLDLVLAALDHRFSRYAAARPPLDLDGLSGPEALKATLNRLHPGPDTDFTMALGATLLAEATHNPDLLTVFRRHGAEPRRQMIVDVLHALRERGDIRPDADIDTVVSMCMGTALAHYSATGTVGPDLADRVVDVLWPALAHPDRDSGGR